MAANRQEFGVNPGHGLSGCSAGEELRVKEAVIELSLSATLLSDMDGHITYVNPAFLRLWGYDTRDDLLGRSLRDFVLDANQADATLEQLQRCGSWHGEHVAVRKNGTLRVVQRSATVVTDCEGKALCLASSFLDVTDRAQVEQSLRASETRYRNIVNAVPVGIALTDSQGHITFYSAQARAMFALADDHAALGTSYRAWVAPDQLENLGPPGCGDPGHARPLEVRLRRADGSEFWGEAAAVLLEEDDLGLDSPQHDSIIVVRDISDRKRSEEALANYAHDLERSNQELEQFAYVASHDLQEPLRMIAAYVQLLAKDYQGRFSPEADEYIAFAVDGARRMQRLIDDLLAYSRVGTRGRAFAPVDCGDVVAEVLNSLHLAVEDAQAAVTCDPLPTLYGDRGQIYQLLQNLIANALKFRGTAQPAIHISARHRSERGQRSAQDQDTWVFAVADNGIGIEAQYLDRIFVIFQRLHSRAHYSGTGIGLAICKKIVERHGGRIWVESAPGQGSTFYFSLPDAPALAQAGRMQSL